MRVLLVLEYFPPHVGGVEILFQNLAEGLARRGHEVDVVTQKLRGTKSYEERGGVRIHRVRVPPFASRYWFSFLSIPKTVRLARRADIIQTTTYNAALPARVAAVVCKKKSVLGVMEVLGDFWGKTELGPAAGKLHEVFEKMIISMRFDRFVAISESTKRDMVKAGVDASKITVIYPGVDYEFFRREKYARFRREIRSRHGIGNEFAYISYGRPGITKGIEYAVRAVPLIAKDIPSSKLVLILSRNPKSGYDKITALIKELKCENNVILLDSRPRGELPKYITAADCVVVPSLTEGFGYSAAEAVALEMPVVASNAKSLPEVVSGKFVLVRPADPSAIAEGVKAVYKKRYDTSEIRRFTTEENVKNHEKLYRNLLSV